VRVRRNRVTGFVNGVKHIKNYPVSVSWRENGRSALPAICLGFFPPEETAHQNQAHKRALFRRSEWVFKKKDAGERK
jgi:hypothetical protein